jgi:hypothetical protein
MSMRPKPSTTSIPETIGNFHHVHPAAPAAEMTSTTNITSGRLAALEAVIETGMRTFIEVGNALLEIRDSRLYRDSFATFEEYCRERWKMSRPRAYQLIDAAGVVSNLSTIVDKPQNEAQARELAGLPADAQRRIWMELTKENPQPTAREIRAAVRYLMALPAMPEFETSELAHAAIEWRKIAQQSAEYRLRAERSAGEELCGIQFTEEEARLWQQLAQVPEEFFEEYIKRCKPGDFDHLDAKELVDSYGHQS